LTILTGFCPSKTAKNGFGESAAVAADVLAALIHEGLIFGWRV
jgi:hypothetical protein